MHPRPFRHSLRFGLASARLLALAALFCHGCASTPSNQTATVPAARLHHGLDAESSQQFWSKVRPMTNLAQAHYRLGRYYQQSGKHQAAIEEFGKALELDATSALVYNGLGVSYDALGDCDRARQAYDKALQHSPKAAYLHNNLGYSRLLCNDPEQAIVHFAKAAALDPNLTRIRNNLQLAELRFQQRYPERQALVALHVPVVTPPELPAAAAPPVEMAPTATATNPPAAPDTRITTTPMAQATAIAPAPAQPKWAATGQPHHPVLKFSALGLQSSPATIPFLPASSQPASAQTSITIQPLVHGTEYAAPYAFLPPVPQADKTCTVEIANGNGIAGMAGRGAAFLREHGFTISRVYNAPHFTYRQSIITYPQENKDTALALAATLPSGSPVALQPVGRKAGNAIRLIVGQDLSPGSFAPAAAQTALDHALPTAPFIAQLD